MKISRDHLLTLIEQEIRYHVGYDMNRPDFFMDIARSVLSTVERAGMMPPGETYHQGPDYVLIKNPGYLDAAKPQPPVQPKSYFQGEVPVRYEYRIRKYNGDDDWYL